MVGRRLLSGKEHEIRFKVCIALCKNIVPETEKLKRRAYIRVSQELFSLGVSPKFVDDVWRKHKGDILNLLNKDLYMVVKKKPGSGRLWKISIAELHLRVKVFPFHFRKNIRTLSFKIGIPRSTIQRAMKLGLLNSLTAIRVLVGTKNSHPIGFYSRNSTKSTVNPNTTIPQIWPPWWCHSPLIWCGIYGSAWSVVCNLFWRGRAGGWLKQII